MIEVNRLVKEKNAKASATAETQKKEEEIRGPRKSIFREYFESAVVTFIMALYGMTFIAQGVDVPTGSMQNTILIGDHLLVNKFIFAPGSHLFFLPQREIKRGDIVVFKWPGDINHPEYNHAPDNIPYQTFYVKRVVGMPGDRLEVRGAEVLINDQPLPEHRIAAIDHSNQGADEIVDNPLRRENEKYSVYYDPKVLSAGAHVIDSEEAAGHYGLAGSPISIPPGYYFVMGDNRQNSLDSRYWGLLRRDLIFGRPMFVYWSYDQSAPKSGNFLLDFFTNTRWNRTGTLIK